MYRKLFKIGPHNPFDVIKDRQTGDLRPFDPRLDAGREAERQPAGPLIPRRFYGGKGISWKNAREEVPTTVHFTTGWELTFYSSLSDPPKGIDLDLACIDEECEKSYWYEEISARLIDRRGKFIWSATPEVGTQILYELIDQAEQMKGQPNPRVEDFLCTIFDNSYLTDAARDEFIAKLGANEDIIATKVYGLPARRGRKVFPEFQPYGVHGCDPFPIPDTWTRYIAIDPGRQVCAVLFLAVPPPTDIRREQVFLYDELYLKNCTAQLFAESVRQKTMYTPVRSGIIDYHAGKTTEMGSGKTIAFQYSAALKEAGFSFATGGQTFVWGNPDIKGGIELIRAGLAIVDGESARWIIFRNLAYLLMEMKNYVYKKDPKIDRPTDEPLQVNNHLIDCFRYAASHSLKWRAPVRKDKVEGGPWYKRLKRQCQERKALEGYGDSIKIG